MAWRPEQERKANRARSTKGNRLRAWREERGLSLQEVGDLVGLGPSALSRIERQDRGVAPMTRVQIARRLGVRIADIFDVEPIQHENEGETIE